jgi:hypothetical protein
MGAEREKMRMKKTKAKLKLMESVTKAIKEAREARIRNPMEIVKKTLNSRIKYKTWKTPKAK